MVFPYIFNFTKKLNFWQGTMRSYLPTQESHQVLYQNNQGHARAKGSKKQGRDEAL